MQQQLLSGFNKAWAMDISLRRLPPTNQPASLIEGENLHAEPAALAAPTHKQRCR
jgi:hypothetical protein